jgi:hypothetical protein
MDAQLRISMERCHEQRYRSGACDLGSQQRDNFEPAFCYCVLTAIAVATFGWVSAFW